MNIMDVNLIMIAHPTRESAIKAQIYIKENFIMVNLPEQVFIAYVGWSQNKFWILRKVSLAPIVLN